MIRRRGPSPDARRGSALAGPARRARGGALALTVLLSTCLAADREAKVVLPPALDVEFSGCGAVLQEGAGIACELPEEGALRLWIKADEDAKTAIAIDGQPLAVTGAPEEVQGGTRHRVEVAPSARALSVVATRGGAHALFRLDLRPPEPAPAAVTEAEALRKKGKLAEAAALLAAPARDPAPRVRAAAIGTLARIALAEGRADEAIAKLEEAAVIHREAGRISDALRDELARVYALLFTRRDFTEARRALERCRTLGAYAEGRVKALYYEGVLADETGDFRAALQHLRAAAEGSERLGLDSHRAAALPVEANVLLALGRERDGAALVQEAAGLADRLESACERADLSTEAGWFALRARGADRARAAELLESARALYGGACPNRAARSLAATNLALLALERGDPGAARRWIDEARREQPEPDDARVTATWRDIEGRLALEAGDPDAALRAYDGLAQLAAAALLPADRWRAALGRARALEARGRDAEAAAAYAQAEALVEDRSLLVPAHEGRAAFLGELDESARRRVGFLLRRAPAEAAAAARRARARALATLQWIDRLGTLGPAERARWEAAVAAYRDEREELEAEAAGAWKLSEVELAAAIARREERERRLAAGLDEALAALGHVDPGRAGAAPSAPAAGELFLVYHPLPRGWAGLAVTQAGVEPRALGEIDPRAPPAELAERLLVPFRDAIAAAKRVRFLAYGDLDQLDFHALPWDDGPLIAALPVAYGVDLPRAARAPARAQGGARAALVIADPRGDLPAARDEAKAVVAALQGEGWQVRRLEGDEATHRALRGALDAGALDLLHYAGHGQFAGQDGWGSGLSLAQGGFFTVSDILTLPRAPAWVVLSGCETARTAGGTRAEGLGLAHAFVVAGAEAVVAAARPVDDRLAARVMAAFHAPTRPGAAAEEAAQRMREAELAARREAPEADWASFRVLVP